MEMPRRTISIVVYAGLYPGIVLATAWVFAGDRTTFNEYALLLAALSVAGILFLLAVRGGTRPFTHDWRDSSPEHALPPPLRSLVFLVMTGVAAVAAVALV